MKAVTSWQQLHISAEYRYHGDYWLLGKNAIVKFLNHATSHHYRTKKKISLPC
jgi:hypothetical protein